MTTTLRAFDSNGSLLWTAQVPDGAAPSTLSVTPSVPEPSAAPPVVAPSGFYPAWPGRNIVLGDKGADVQAWQDRLNHLGFVSPSETTGTFDAGTEAATKTFQSAQGLDPSGQVDGTTWAAAFHPFSGVS